MKKLSSVFTIILFLIPLFAYGQMGIGGHGPTYGGDPTKPGTVSELKLDHTVETLNADRTILITDKPVLWFDCNGSDRNVTLCPMAANSTDLVFTIVNRSDGAGEDLVVRDGNATPVTLITIGPEQGQRFSCDGTDWEAWFDNGFTYDGIAGTITTTKEVHIADANDTSIIKHVLEPGLGGRLTIGLDETARSIVICDVGDVDTDLGLSVQSSPTLYVMSADGSYYSKLVANGLHIVGTSVILEFSGTYGLQLLSNYGARFKLGLNKAAGNPFILDSGTNIELTDTNAEQSWVYIEPKINQSTTAAYNGLKIKVTETATGNATTGDGGGTNNLILAGTSADPDMFKVDNVGRICIAESSDPTASADHVFFYGKNVTGTAEAFAADAAANAAQLTPHNFDLFEPDSLEAYPWSYYAENKALGIKINVDMAGAIRAIEQLTGKTFIYTQNITKEVNLEKVYKDAWMADYIKTGIQETEITKAQALEIVQVDADKWYLVETPYQVCDENGTCVDKIKIVKQRKKIGETVTGYELVNGEVKPRVEPVWETEKADKVQVKAGMNFNEVDGKFYMITKPSKAQAITAAATGFKFDPPKWLGDRLKK